MAFLGESLRSADMSMRSVLRASLLSSASKVDRKGLRDIGLLLELERLALAGEWRPGEAARLRKGLLEERLSVRPGDGWRSADKTRLSALLAPVSSPAPTHGETSDDGAHSPGIDGSASMMLPLLVTLHACPIKCSN